MAQVLAQRERETGLAAVSSCGSFFLASGRPCSLKYRGIPDQMLREDSEYELVARTAVCRLLNAVWRVPHSECRGWIVEGRDCITGAVKRPEFERHTVSGLACGGNVED